MTKKRWRKKVEDKKKEEDSLSNRKRDDKIILSIEKMIDAKKIKKKLDEEKNMKE